MKVFISSTYLDLIDYRKHAVEALERLGQQNTRMEIFGAQPEEPLQVVYKEIESCDLFVGIYAHRYGYIPDNIDISITEAEYHHAKQNNISIFCFLIEEDFPWNLKLADEGDLKEKLICFKNGIDKRHVRDTFTSPENLAYKVSSSIGRYISEKNEQSNHTSREDIRPTEASPPSYLLNLTDTIEYDSHAVSYCRSELRDDARLKYPNILSDGEFLNRVGCRTNGYLNIAGVLLFTAMPTIKFPSAYIQCIRYDSTKKETPIDRITLEGYLLQQFVEARNYIATHIRKKEPPSTASMQAETIYEYPMVCVREVLANALVHRDYSDNERIAYVSIFLDRIEVRNPGYMKNRPLVKEEPVLLGYYKSEPVQKNMPLSRVVSSVKMMEMEGSGIDRSVNDCINSNAPEPTVLHKDGYVIVTIFPSQEWEEEVIELEDTAFNEEHLTILKRGVKEWNLWRSTNPDIRPRLSNTDLSKENLSGVNLNNAILYRTRLVEANLQNASLKGADLREGILRGGILKKANLSYANLQHAILDRTDLSSAMLRETNLEGANLNEANLDNVDLTGAKLQNSLLNRATLINADLQYVNFREANLSEANLFNTDLRYVNFTDTNLFATDLSHSTLGFGTIGDIDLSITEGLDSINHDGPTKISTSTLKRSKGKISHDFLKGVGLSDWEIEATKLYMSELTPSELENIIYRVHDLLASNPVQVHNLFISYSHKDASFVNSLEKFLSTKNIRFWRDVHDAVAGPLEKIIFKAIENAPTVLLILSKNSISSDWVEHEIEWARKTENEMNRHIICPIAIDDSWKTAEWSQSIMNQLKQYNILDFSKWKDRSYFESQFNKLLKGLALFYDK